MCRREGGKFYPAETRRDMQAHVLPVLVEGASFPRISLDSFDQVVCALDNSDAFAGRYMNALANIGPNAVVIGFGVLLLLKCPDMPIPCLVGIVNNPRFALNVLCGFPFALADAHCRPPLESGFLPTHVVVKRVAALIATETRAAPPFIAGIALTALKERLAAFVARMG